MQILRSGGRLVSPSVVETPFHEPGTPQPHPHGLIDRILFLEAEVEDEPRDERATHAVAAPAVDEDGTGPRATQHAEDPLDCGIVLCRGGDGNVDVLEAR